MRKVFWEKLFGKQLEFRVRLFSVLASAGALIGFFITIFDIVNQSGAINVITAASSMVISIVLLVYSSKSGRYQLCYMVTIIVIFLGIFPLFFFLSGAYYGSMPVFFILAIIFTVVMLEGKKALAMVFTELAIYIPLFFIAYKYPQLVKWYASENEIFIDVLISFAIASAALGITMFLHFRLYNQQYRELEAARKKAEDFAKMKSELFAGMSHEMRTPLTVMSAYAQFAVEQIKAEGASEQTLADLTTISDEAKRLAEMADGTLKILLSASESGKPEKQQAAIVNIVNPAERLVKLLEPVVSRKGRRLTLKFENDIQNIRGDQDEIIQLLWNILHNAIIHSTGSIELGIEAENGASVASGAITITVKDDGEGIASSLLPRIFERGVSGKKGGSGIGLSVCRDIAKRHGGDIIIESAEGRGTCVTVTLKGIES